ncbi:MAG: DUF2851 family protein, partial [Chloroflexi bacterium]|nr:DUF2851 family protein [Chloroflexota bacterium]
MNQRITEKEISQMWQCHLPGGSVLTTEEGETIAIVYAGRLNDGRGGDFRDAVIATRLGLLHGDVEIHMKSSDWVGHRHHRDVAYNRVILHVVMWHDIETAITLQDGRQVPTLALERYLRRALVQPALTYWGAGTPCSRHAVHPDSLACLLDEAGEERFFTKAARFQNELTRMEAGQSLYQGLMEALGYSKNKLPFLELSRRLPLRVLESLARSGMLDKECLAYLRACLMETAGLVPFHSLNENIEPMSPGDWQVFKVRPSNSPLNRLAAMAHLLVRYRRKGLLGGLIDLVAEVPLEQGYHTLEEGLMVTVRSQQGGKGLTLLGRERAAEIIINVLLPFTLAWSSYINRTELGRKAVQLYRSYPKLAANSIIP